jgi:pimeloyl-ACP methyl ester carboxylesterase
MGRGARIVAAIVGGVLAMALTACVREAPATGSGQAVQVAAPPPAPVGPGPADSGHVSVGGLDIYHEIHGVGDPLLMLHGAYTTIDTSFGAMLPALARDRMVVAVELQGHGHTADLDRPLRYEQLADDTAAVLRALGLDGKTDVFGYSLGGNTALQLAIRHPELVDRLVVASAYYDPDGLYPGMLEGIEHTKPEDFTGSGLPEAYAAVAPDPDGWPTLVEKVKQLDLTFAGWTPDDLAVISAPSLVIVGDSDIVTTQHAADMFAALGGGVPGDFAGLPRSQLAVLPGTTHIGVLAERGEELVTMLGTFLATDETP